IPDQPLFPVPALDTSNEAQAWLDAERPNLIAAVCSDVALDQVIALANSLDRYLNREAHYRLNLAVLKSAVAAARTLDDRAAEGRALGGLGRVYGQLSRQDEAMRCLSAATSIAAEVGDTANRSSAMNSLGCVYYDRGEYKRAVQHLEDSVVLGKETSPWLEA